MRTTAADGVLLVDKPAGITSHDVVAAARRALGERRIGHGGTLDPFATGLLVLLVGRATRLLPFLDGEPKVYDAVIRFGAETDTDDVTGEVTRTAPPPARDAVERALRSLTGRLEQRPPAFSAKHVDGRRAYAAARQGEPLPLPPVPVTVHAWTVRSWDGDDLHATVSCGAGTYIRALARDLGLAVGSAAHLAALRRVRSGPFDVASAAPLDAVRAGECTLLPPRAAVGSLPVQPLDEEGLARVSHGRSVPAAVPGDRAALVDAAGALVAVAARANEAWLPRVVLRDG